MLNNKYETYYSIECRGTPTYVYTLEELIQGNSEINRHDRRYETKERKEIYVRVRNRISTNTNQSRQLILIHITQTKLTKMTLFQNEVYPYRNINTNDLTLANRIPSLKQPSDVTKARGHVLFVIVMLLVSDEKTT